MAYSSYPRGFSGADTLPGPPSGNKRSQYSEPQLKEGDGAKSYSYEITPAHEEKNSKLEISKANPRFTQFVLAKNISR